MKALRLVIVFGLAACGSTNIDAANYDRSCTKDADCAEAYFGDACQLCGCPNGALNTKSSMKHASDLAAAQKTCGTPIGAICAPCIDRQVACVSGTCAQK